jgi:hypothetical protein
MTSKQYNKEWRRKNPARLKATLAKYYQKLKESMLKAYSSGKPACKWCGQVDIDILCLDHVNNDGNIHRKALGGTMRVYQWIRKHNYPSGFQVLCYNCNNKKKVLHQRSKVRGIS